MKNNATREAWNETSLYHIKAVPFEEILSKIQNNQILNTKEMAVLKKLDLKNKHVCHLCCNNGREAIAISKVFSCFVLGVDISDNAIEIANKLQDADKANVQFVRSDVLDLMQNEKLKSAFDVVYITAGTLNWIDNLDEFFDVVNYLLKPKGKFFMYEIHPVCGMFDYKIKQCEVENNPQVTNNYFMKVLPVSTNGIDYLGHNVYQSKAVIEYQHTLTEILSALIKSNFKLLEFWEDVEDISAVYHNLENGNIPLSLVAILEKENAK